MSFALQAQSAHFLAREGTHLEKKIITHLLKLTIRLRHCPSENQRTVDRRVDGRTEEVCQIPGTFKEAVMSKTVLFKNFTVVTPEEDGSVSVMRTRLSP